jgi:hypothetical protein
MKRAMILLVLAFGLVAGGCKKDEPKKEDKKAEAPKPAPEPEVHLPDMAPDEPSTKVEGPVTASDLEPEAEKTLHYENLEAELDRLEAEIAGS